jgi:hypothetical protein
MVLSNETAPLGAAPAEAGLADAALVAVAVLMLVSS